MSTVEEDNGETLIPGPMGIGMVSMDDVWWVEAMRKELNDPKDIRSRRNELARVELLHYLDSRNPDPKSCWGSSSHVPPKARTTWSGLWSLYNRARLQDLEAIEDNLAPYRAVYEWFQKVFRDGAERYAKEAGEKGMAEARRLSGMDALPPTTKPPRRAPRARRAATVRTAVWIRNTRGQILAGGMPLFPEFMESL